MARQSPHGHVTRAEAAHRGIADRQRAEVGGGQDSRSVHHCIPSPPPPSVLFISALLHTPSLSSLLSLFSAPPLCCVQCATSATAWVTCPCSVRICLSAGALHVRRRRSSARSPSSSTGPVTGARPSSKTRGVGESAAQRKNHTTRPCIDDTLLYQTALPSSHRMPHAPSNALTIRPSATLALSGYWETEMVFSVQSTSAGPLA